MKFVCQPSDFAVQFMTVTAEQSRFATSLDSDGLTGSCLMRRDSSPRKLSKCVLVTLIAICSLLLLHTNNAAQSDPIRVLYYPPWNISKLPMYLARDAGLFDHAGLTVAWTDPGSNEKLLAALKNGEADIAVVSANHVVQNNATGGTRMTLVGNTGFNYSALVAAPSIKTIGDLLGKKVGTGEPGSTPDQLTRLALRKLGIDPENDVTLVPLAEGRNSDRVRLLLSGDIAAMMVTAETLYTLEKNGALARLHRLSDHKELKIYAGGGADYAVATSFLKSRREDVKKFMAGICQGIALARSDKAQALPFIAKSGRGLDAAAVEYLYRLYVNEVIPLKPHVKIEGVELALQMAASSVPAAQAIKVEDLIDRALVPELEKEGRCNF
jgi:ABC-type nitrate/sulfonate/bicarbonate transport system substrate-binding protein